MKLGFMGGGWARVLEGRALARVHGISLREGYILFTWLIVGVGVWVRN